MMKRYIQYQTTLNAESQDSEFYYEAVRLVLGDKNKVLADSDVQLILHEAEAQLSPEEFGIIEGFFKKIKKGLKKFGSGVVRVTKKVLPVVGKVAQIAAPIVGTVLGGPLGTKLGATVGKVLGKVTQIGKVAQNVGTVLGGRKVTQATTFPQYFQPQFRPQPQPQPMPRLRLPLNAALNGNVQLMQHNQPAVNQLLGFLQNPALIQSLLGQVLGGRSQGTVQMATPNQGITSNIPFGSFMNLLSQLSTQAAIEANGYVEDEPTYLYNEHGEFAIENPDSSEARAERLLEILQENTVQNYSLPEIKRKQDAMTEWFVKSGMIR